MDAPDPLSLLEREKSVLLRKLRRCHEALALGLCTLARIDRRDTYRTMLLMRDALTDRGGDKPG